MSEEVRTPEGATTPVQHPLWMKFLLAAVAFCLVLLVIAYEYLLLQWPMLREAHFLHYIAYLVNEHGFVPYRDILETSWFGTFLYHMAIGKWFGYTSMAFREADIAILAILATITWLVLRKLDIWLAWTGTLSAVLAYLHYGPANTLQRDFVLLLPVMAALLASLQTQWTALSRALLVGMCFGAAVTIKPHSLIGLPVMLVLLQSQALRPAPWLQVLALCAAGGLLVFGAGLAWLAWCGGLADFLDMTFNYLPLYQSFNGAHQITTTAERWQNTVYWWKLFVWVWPYSIAAALVFTWFNTRQGSPKRAIAMALAALAACYNVYPLLAGKFWDYHWIPYTYFAVLATSCLLLPPRSISRIRHPLPVFGLLAFLYAVSTQYFPGRGLDEQIRRYPDISIDHTFDDEAASFLRQHLKPDEKIQIIEQGGPATLYLLKAEAVLATPYPGSFLFLHHVESPYVHHAQQRFMSLLNASPPALFLVMTDFTRPSGPGTIKEIPGLREFLQQHYEKIWQTPGFTVWQYKKPAVSSGSASAQ